MKHGALCQTLWETNDLGDAELSLTVGKVRAED